MTGLQLQSFFHPSCLIPIHYMDWIKNYKRPFRDLLHHSLFDRNFASSFALRPDLLLTQQRVSLELCNSCESTKPQPTLYAESKDYFISQSELTQTHSHYSQTLNCKGWIKERHKFCVHWFHTPLVCFCLSLELTHNFF